MTITDMIQLAGGVALFLYGMTIMGAGLEKVAGGKMQSILQKLTSSTIRGILLGTFITGIIQSSAGTIVIVIGLVNSGIMALPQAVGVIMGANIGTTFTPMVAAVGASKGAKRSAVIHLYFNLISSVVFLAGIYLIKCTIGVPFWDEILNKGSIANIHTLSSVVATICFIPFTKVLIWLAEHTVRDKPGEEQDLSMPVLDERLLTSPAVAIQQAQNAVEKMAARAARNYRAAMPLLAGYKDDAAAVVNQREDLIDRMEVTLTNYLIKISDRELGEMESHRANSLLAFVTEVERIGDYAINVTERAAEMRDKELTFSDQAQRELQMLGDAIGEIIDLTVQAMHSGDAATAAQVEPLEETVDTICETLRTRHIQRLKDGKCQLESGIIFLDVLTNLERISDHCSNIAARLLGMESDSELDPHALKKAMHNGNTKGYDDALNQYRKKYSQVLAEG